MIIGYNWKSPWIPSAKIHSNSSSLTAKFWITQQNILFHKITVQKSNQWTIYNAERMKNKKFHIYNLRNGREEKVYDIPLSTGEEKSPMSHYGTLLAATLIVKSKKHHKKMWRARSSSHSWKSWKVNCITSWTPTNMNSLNLEKYLKTATW